jgi:SAM-dependent methyltransferase
MSGRFKDHFSQHAAGYAEARPDYPPALLAWLAAQCAQTGCAWDVGCGNGQAARGLAAHFTRVIATDPSAEQIAQAPADPRIEYRVEAAEQPSLAEHSVDLVCVAQALHWFEQTAFHAAVQRVLRPGGVFAAWSYGLCRVSPAVDTVFMQLYDGVLGQYWPAERRHVESGYRELPFPYAELQPPAFTLRQHWTLAQYLDYLRSWSATQRCIRAEGSDPVSALGAAFAAAWGGEQTVREVQWALALRVGRKLERGGRTDTA